MKKRDTGGRDKEVQGERIKEKGDIGGKDREGGERKSER